MYHAPWQPLECTQNEAHTLARCMLTTLPALFAGRAVAGGSTLASGTPLGYLQLMWGSRTMQSPRRLCLCALGMLPFAKVTLRVLPPQPLLVVAAAAATVMEMIAVTCVAKVQPVAAQLPQHLSWTALGVAHTVGQTPRAGGGLQKCCLTFSSKATHPYRHRRHHQHRRHRRHVPIAGGTHAMAGLR